MTDDIMTDLAGAINSAASQAASAHSAAALLEEIRDTFRRTVGTEVPEWRWAKVPDRSKVADLSDEAFAARRVWIRNNNHDAIARAAASAEFAVAILDSCRAKVKRVETLRAQAGKLPKNSPEHAAALGRIQATTYAANALYKRLWLVVSDFAIIRKQIVAKLVNLTTQIVDKLPDGHPALADAFSGTSRDIRNSLVLLAEMDERIYAKKGMKA